METITKTNLLGNFPKQSVGEKKVNAAGTIYLGKIVILSVLFLSLSVFNSHSQLTPGVTIGYNHAIFGGPDARAWGFLDSDPMFASRILIGVFVLQSLTENLFFQPGLSFSTRGTRYINEWELYNPNTNQFSLEKIRLQKKLAYLSIPLTLRYYLSSNLSLAVGPEISLLILANAIRSEGDLEARKTNVMEEYHRLELAARVAASYHLTSNLYMQLGFLYGLSNIVKYEEYGSYVVRNMLIQLSVGYMLSRR